MEKHEIVNVMLDIHEWRMETGDRAVFFEHATEEEDGNYLTISVHTGGEDDDIKSSITIEYEDADAVEVAEKLEDWKDKVEKYERVSRGAI